MSPETMRTPNTALMYQQNSHQVLIRKNPLNLSPFDQDLGQVSEQWHQVKPKLLKPIQKLSEWRKRRRRRRSSVSSDNPFGGGPTMHLYKRGPRHLKTSCRNQREHAGSIQAQDVPPYFVVDGSGAQDPKGRPHTTETAASAQQSL